MQWIGTRDLQRVPRHSPPLTLATEPGAAVITSCVPEDNKQLPPAAEMGVNAIAFYMMEEGMQFVGSLKLQGNVPCIRCGVGDKCKMSGVKMLYGPTACVDSVGIKQFEEHPITIQGAQELGRKLAAALAS